MWHHIFINYEITAKIFVKSSSDSLLRWEKTRHAASTVNLLRTWLINTGDYFHRQLLFSRSLTPSVNPRSRHFPWILTKFTLDFCLNKTWLWWRQREIIWNQGEVKSRPSKKSKVFILNIEKFQYFLGHGRCCSCLFPEQHFNLTTGWYKNHKIYKLAHIESFILISGSFHS